MDVWDRMNVVNQKLDDLKVELDCPITALLSKQETVEEVRKELEKLKGDL